MELKHLNKIVTLTFILGGIAIAVLLMKANLQYKVIHGKPIDLNNSEYVCRPK